MSDNTPAAEPDVAPDAPDDLQPTLDSVLEAEPAAQAEAAEPAEPVTQADATPAAKTDAAEPAEPAEPVTQADATPAAEPAAQAEAAEPAEPGTQADATPTAPRPDIPRPRPRPTPRPHPHPAAPAASAASSTPAADAHHPETHTLLSPPSDPTPWGHVAEDGTVVVHAPDGERAVGSYPGATPEEALAYFGRKFDELVAQVDLAEQRLASPEAPIKDIHRALAAVAHALPEANVVGDIAGLFTRITALQEQATQRKAEIDAARAQAREESASVRRGLVEEAEKIAGTDQARMQWRQSGERMKVLFDEWKAAQSAGPRLDKSTEDELWKRFSHARNSFDRMRRQYFAKLHAEQEKVKSAKERIVAEAEALSSSTNWGETAAAYRTLMDRWKASGRASRKDDDALWARFRAAQDVFFEARSADANKTDQEFAENLKQKEALLVEAEAMLPIKDLGAAKAKLRSIHDRWDKIGKVPRSAMSSVERRMKAVEQAVREQEDDKWRRSNPETKARAEGALDQLDKAIAALEVDLAKAKTAGNDRKIREAEEALKARRAWRDQIAQIKR